MKTGVQAGHRADLGTGLSAGQLEHFDEHGYLLVRGMLDPATDLAPILDEYDGVLDRLAHTLFAQGKVSSPYPDLPFGERISRMYEESGEMLNQWFDFHLPQRHVTYDTPFWVGPAVFGTLVNPKLLDAVESVIGGEIYSNPVQHVRIKPPEGRMGRQPDGRPVYGATVWHQDNGVIQEDGDQSRHPHRVVPDHRRAERARLPARGAGQPPRRNLHPLSDGEGFQRGSDP